MSFGLLAGLPSEDWELNVLLLTIGKGLNQQDLEQLKFLCSGSRGIPRRVLSQLTTPEQFFTYLRQQSMISRDNLLLLQAFMWHINKKDLHQLASDYAKRTGNILYFYTPDEEPEQGFKHIQFHVEGNLDRFQRPQLEALRATLARLLFVPQEFIFLCGVEPSGSLTLTFMLPEDQADRVEELFKEHKDSFGQLGVDGITVDDSEYIDPTIDMRRRASAPAGSVTEAQLRALYERSLHLESQVEESEIRAIESRADATVARQEACEWRRKENYFRALLARIVEQDKDTPSTSTNKLTSLGHRMHTQFDLPLM